MGVMCQKCPQRLLLMILEKMGEDVTELRNDGCPWSWIIKVEDTNTKQVKEIDICGAEALPRFLNDYGASNLQTAGAIESMRNQDAENVSNILKAVAHRMSFDKVVLEQFTTAVLQGIREYNGRLLLDVSPQLDD